MEVKAINNMPVERLFGEDVVWQGIDNQWYYTIRGCSDERGGRP